MDPVSKLYDNYNILADPANKPSEHEAQFLEILQSIKGETPEKMLACQFIPRFFKDFPHLTETSLDALFDLVEDEDVNVRKHVIRQLPTFCSNSKDYASKIADILTQLLHSPDASEVAVVHSSLVRIMEMDMIAALHGLFSQITGSEYDIIRKRAVQFLCRGLRVISSELLTKEVQEFFLEECKKAFRDIAAEEFLGLMSLLSNFKIAKTIPGQQALVDLVAEQAELDTSFDATSIENAACLLQCIKQAQPHFSPYVSSARFVNYICLQVLPKLEEMKQLEKGEEMSSELIKLFAEMCPHSSDLKDVEGCVAEVYRALLDYVPQPPPPEIEDDGSQAEDLNLQFTHIECLMYILTRLAQQHPDFLVAKENVERFSDLKKRLQYLARKIQTCVKTVRESLRIEKNEGSEENKVKTTALRTFTNINSLIRDLFRTPPSFKTPVTLSWKPAAATIKREHERTSLDEANKLSKKDSKGERELYAPPSGKYSKTSSMYSRPRGSGFYSRGRGRRFY